MADWVLDAASVILPQVFRMHPEHFIRPDHLCLKVNTWHWNAKNVIYVEKPEGHLTDVMTATGYDVRMTHSALNLGMNVRNATTRYHGLTFYLTMLPLPELCLMPGTGHLIAMNVI